MTHADGTGTYWDIIRAVYGDKYNITFETMTWARAVNMVKQNRADILMGVPPSKADTFYLPKQHIDIEYPIYLLFDESQHDINSIDDLSELTIAGRATYGFEYHLPKNTKFYGVDSIKLINKLIFSGRIDGALVYSYNAYLADPSKTLSQLEIIPKEKLYIAIAQTEKGEQLRDEFDTKMDKLIKAGSLAKFFPTPKDYLFAEYQPEKPSSEDVDLILIPKVSIPGSGALATLGFDDRIGISLLENLKPHQFNLAVNNFKLTNEKLLSDSPTCMVNASKRKDREAYLWYSDPIYAYLPPRVINLAKNAKALAPYINKQGEIHLDKLIDSPLKIAINGNNFITNMVKKKISRERYEKLIKVRFIEQKENVVNHLINEKIDAFIAFPTMVSNVTYQKISVDSLQSYRLEEPIIPLAFGYLVCNKKGNNQAIINDFNELLSSQQNAPKIYTPTLESLDPQSREDFAQALKLKLK